MKIHVPIVCRVLPDGSCDLSLSQPVIQFKPNRDERRYADWVESLPLKERARRFTSMPEYRKMLEK